MELDETLDEIEPTLDFNEEPRLEARPIKRPEMDDLMARAMAGLLPRNRPLKPWEPQFLDERHLQMVMMRATGMKQNVIANILGTDDSRVSIILNHPDAQYILTKMVSFAADEVLDIQTRIRAYQGEALDKIVEVMRNTQDQRLASANALELLRMGGNGAIEKKEIKAEVAVAKEHVSILAQAIAESKQLPAIENVNYRVLASGPGDAGGVSPEASMESGHSSTSLPPSSDSLTPEAKVA